MKNFAVIAALMLCLLQEAPASPRPNFGINVAAPGATQLDGFVAAAQSLVDTADDNINPTLTSGYPNLQNILDDMNEVGGYITSLGDSIANPLITLVDATTGTVATLFSDVGDEIDNARFYISELGFITDDLGPIIGNAVNDQLTDDFNRIDGGLVDLQHALDDLQAVVAPGVTIKPSFVNAVSNAVNKLKAYLPVAIYTVESTINLLKIADEYAIAMAASIASYTSNIDNGIGSLLDNHATAFSGEFDGYMDDVIAALAQERTDVDGLSSVASAPLTAALDGFSDAVGNYKVDGAIDDFESHVVDQLATRRSEVIGLVSMPEVLANVNTNPNVAAVIQVLIENDKYSEFCFYKYAYLIMSYSDTAVADVDDCVTREFLRLRSLMTFVMHLTDMLHFDFEDIYEQLSACIAMVNPSKVSACATELTGYYEGLNDAFANKYDLVMDMAETEIEASTSRTLACLIKKIFENMSGDIGSILTDINDCRVNGPYVG